MKKFFALLLAAMMVVSMFAGWIHGKHHPNTATPAGN